MPKSFKMKSMKIFNKILPVFLALVLSSSCETTKEGLQQSMQRANVSTDNPAADIAFNNLTNNGTNFPTGQGLARVVSNPGDLSHKQGCQEPIEAPEPVTVSVSTKSASGSPFRRNVSPNGKYSTYSYSLKRHPRPRRGCLPVENVSFAQAKAALASQKLTYKTGPGAKKASEAEVRALGAAILSVQHLNGGPLKMGMPANGQPSPLPIVFTDASGSQQEWHQIKIGRSGHQHYGSSVAQHVHEWAHLIGNNGGYERYRKEVGVPPYCNVSGYSANNPNNSRRKEYNEHFAEVMTAFVTEPASLKNHPNSACRKAFDFFKKFFKKGDRAKECM